MNVRMLSSVIGLALSLSTPLTPMNSLHAAPDLPRRGSVGLGARADDIQGAGLLIAQVREGGPAAAAGIKVGDRLLTINAKPINTQSDFAEAFRIAPEGAKIDVRILRDGAEQTIAVTMAQTPKEVIDGSNVTYSSVTVPAGYKLRTIISEPTSSTLAKSGKMPAFFFVQGLQCQTIDRPTNLNPSDTKLVHAMAKAGYVTIRVDKPGLGDSQGPPCSEINLQTELEGYKAALDQLRALPSVDPDRIYIFGHSMGGVMAPYLTQHANIRGTVVYGTVVRTWFEYALENLRRQMTLNGAPAAEVNQALEAEAKIGAMVYVQKKTLGDAWARYPDLRQESPMATEKSLFGRDLSFFHQLQDLNLAEAWSKSTGSVLAIYGEYDWVTAEIDHAMIADIVSKRTSGAGTSLTLPKSDHAFTTHPDLQTSLTKIAQGPFDQNLPKVILAWIDQLEGRALKGANLLPPPGSAQAQ